MHGTLVRRTWEYDPARYASSKFRRACHDESFVPHELADFDGGMQVDARDLARAEARFETRVSRYRARVIGGCFRLLARLCTVSRTSSRCLANMPQRKSSTLVTVTPCSRKGPIGNPLLS